MSWYVLQCRTGQEEKILNSCRRHLSETALEEAFVFRCERLWRTEGSWIPLVKDMFPGYVFLQSSCPEQLSIELEQYRKILRVMEEPGYLISIYQEEEAALRSLCGDRHVLELSYGYKNASENRSTIISGPLSGQEDRILRINWHKRIAHVGMQIGRRQAVVWAGVVPAGAVSDTEGFRSYPKETSLSDKSRVLVS